MPDREVSMRLVVDPFVSVALDGDRSDTHEYEAHNRRGCSATPQKRIASHHDDPHPNTNANDGDP